MSKYTQAVDHIKIGNPKPRLSANRMRLMAGASFFVALSCLGAAPASAASCGLSTPSTWNIAGNGNWSTAADWNPAGAPNSAATNVCITNGTSTVALDSTFSVDNLQIGSGNTLNMPGTILFINGPQIVNAGTLGVNNGLMALNVSTALSGGGTVTFAGGSAQQQAGGLTLTNIDNTIQGFGGPTNNNLAMNNQGTVNANVTGQTMTFGGGGGLTNTGLLEATNGGFLQLSSVVTNTGGNITASGAGSIVNVATSITGGTLNTSGGGVIQANGSATLGNVTISAGSTYTIASGNNTLINAGTLTNNGIVALGGLIGLNGNLSLTGGGTLTMAAGSGIQQQAGGLTLTNTNNLVQGAGGLTNNNLGLNNQATVNANVSGQTLTLSGGGGVTNTGLLEATGGGILQLSNAVTNTGGNITASGAGSIVNVSTTIIGGTLNTSGGGVMQANGSATLGNVTISSGSTYTIAAANNTLINAGTLTNQGTIALGGILGLNGSLSLTGGGTLTMAAGSGIQQQAGGLTLTNTNNLIQGAGGLTNNNLALNNQATVNANVAGQTLLLSGGGGVTNTGLLEATGGGILQLSNPVNNAGGHITANGGTVNVNTTIQAGTLTTLGGGVIQTLGSAVLDGRSVPQGGQGTLTIQGTYTDGPGANTFVEGTINNTGTIALNGNGGGVVVGLNTDTILTGGGTVTMTVAGPGGSVTIQQQAGGLTLTNANNLIQGAGTIGNGGLALNNQATVNANATGQTLLLSDSGGTTNTGLLEATNGGILQLSAAVNNTSGNITASGAGSTVNVSTTIVGGTLNTNGGGVMQSNGNATLDNVTISAGSTYTGAAGNTFVNAGTITNQGTIALGGLLGLNGSVSLIGGGALTMATGATVQQQAGGLTLTNTNHLIQGAGTIGNGGLALNNQATINANVTGQTLLLSDTGGTTNTGLLEATNGGILQLSAGVANTGGNITASGAGSTVNVTTTITGGTLNTNGGGVMQTNGNATLDNVTISAGSTYTSVAGNTFLNAGTITNQGTIALGGLLGLNGSVSLTGSGTLTMTGSAVIQQQAGGLTLTNTNNLIQGTGTIGNGGLTFVNGGAGTVNASVSGQTLLLSGTGGNTNNGVFEAAQGSTLLVSTNLTNFSGTTLTGGVYQTFGSVASPAIIQINSLGNTGGEIHTNAATILLDGPNSKIVDSAGNDALSNLSANSGSFTVRNGRNYTSAGAIANTGLIAVGNPLGIDAPSTLTMTGALTGTTGTLQINPQGNVIVGANSTTGTLTHNGSAPGSLALGTNTITVSTDYTNANFGTGNSFNNHANVSGTGHINAAGNVGVSVSGAGITNGTTATPTLALGNVHVGSTTNVNVNVNNTGTTGPVLRGAIQNTGLTTTGLNIAAANFGPIALGGSQAQTLTFAPTAGGALAGQNFKVVTNFDNVQSQTVAVTGTAWNLAQATINTAQPVAFGNHHVNDVVGTQQAISVSNSAPAAFSERLDASVSGTTGGVTTNGGSFGLLGAGATNNSSIIVGIDTSSAGNKAGQATLAFVSNGSGTSGLGTTPLASQNVNVTGAVYNLASSNVIAPINFGVVHVGTGIHTQTLSITNTAAAGAFSEGLDSSFGSYTNNGGTVNPAFAGSITNLTAGSNNNTSMVASLDTSTAGFVSGNITIHQASNGAGTSGLGITALANQNPAVSGTVQATVTNLAQPIINNAQPISFGNVRINTATAAQTVSVTNGAPSGGFSEGLIGSATGTTGTGITASGSFGSAGNSLAPQATNPPNPAGSGSISVNIDTSSAGAKSGNAMIDFKSDGTAFAGGAVTDLGNTNVAVTGNVYRLATGSAVNPADIGAARVGGTLSGNISVTNTAANDGFSEKLDASITATTPSVTGSSGNITGLAAGATNSSGLTVTLDTSTSGVTSGTATIQYKSNGTGIDGGAPVNNGSQIVTINGKVYQTAVAAVTPGPINFGIVHVNQVVTAQSINVANTASGFLVDSITGNIASVTGGAAGAFTHSGSLGAGVTAGGNSNALQVGLNTGTAGVFSGNANLALASHDASLSDVALTTAPVLVQAQVNNFANGAFVSKGGAGALSGAGSNFLLNFGTLVQGGTLTSNLAVLNNVVGPADDLSGVFSVPVLPADLTLSGFNSFQNLAAGSQFGGLQVNLDTSFTNFFDIFVTLSPTGSNASGFSAGMADIVLELKGNIVAQNNKVPEPLTLSLFGTGVAGLFLRERRRKRKTARA